MMKRKKVLEKHSPLSKFRKEHLFPLLLLYTLLLILMPASAQVESINAATIEGEETLSIFFDTPQSFPPTSLQKQFSVKRFNSEQERYIIDQQGQWHLSKDGFRLSYFPVNSGSYEVTTELFPHQKEHSQRSAEIYIGEPSQKVKILGRGPVLPIENGALPIEMIGTDQVDLEFYAIDNLPSLLEQYYIGNDLSSWSFSQLSREITPEAIFRYHTTQPATKGAETHHHRIPLPKEIASGAYLVTVNPAGEIYKNIDARIIFITDIGLQARLYPQKTLIIANQFSTGEPLEEGSLEVWRNQKGKLIKERNLCQFKAGLCEISQRLKSQDVIVVRKGEDLSVLPLKEIALDLNEYAVTGEASRDEIAYLYSNRTLYRPGEVATINLLIRDYDARPLPAQPITLSLIAPDGKRYRDYRLDPQADGFYQKEIPLPASGQLGLWQIEARTDLASEAPLGALKIYLEEFLPERMALTLLSPKKPYLYHEDLPLTIDSHYLFGAPAAENRYRLENQLSIDRTPFIGKEDWYAGMIEFPFDRYPAEYLQEGLLDRNGHAEVTLQLPQSPDTVEAPFSGILKLKSHVAILDGSLLGITREIEQQFWPHKEIPVIRPLFRARDLGYGDSARFELFSAGSDGEIVPSQLLITLKYQDPSCIWIYSAARGWDCQYSSRYQVIEQKSVDADQIIHYEVTPNSWGEYLLEVKDLQSGLISQYTFSGRWEESNSGQLPAVKPQHLNLTTENPFFTPGQALEVTIDAPLAGNLTLLIEGEALLYHENLRVEAGKTSINLPTDLPWDRHNLYLSALLLSRNSEGELVRSFGVIPLKVNEAHREIRPEIDLPAVVKPNQPLTIRVTLPEESTKMADKSPFYGTISITDSGILNMIPQKPLSLFDAFFGQRRYSATIIDYYSRLFKRGEGSLLNPQFGGDGLVVEEENQLALNLTEMPTVSLSSPLLSFNDGEASWEVELPDFNGEAIVAVKLFNDSQVGEAEKALIIRAPIIADLLPPPFIRVGDESALALTLINMAPEESLTETLTEALKREGVPVTITLSSDTIQVLDTAESSVQKSPEQTPTASKELDQARAEEPSNKMQSSKELLWQQHLILPYNEKRFELIPITLPSLATAEGATTEAPATVTLTLESPLYQATRHYQIGIVPKTVQTAQYHRQYLSSNQKIELSHWQKQYEAGAKSFLTLSKNPTINPALYALELFNYPYDCSEQLTSQTFPWLFKSPALNLVKRSFYQAHQTDESREESAPQENSTAHFSAWEESFVEDHLAQLLARQQPDGGFPLWNSGPSFLPATNYVTDLLVTAKRDHYTIVTQEALDAAYRYLQRALNQTQAEFNLYGLEISDYANGLTRDSLASISYASWLLADGGKIYLADLLFLPQLAPRLTPLATTYLGGALMILGETKGGLALFSTLPSKIDQAEQYYGYYQSSISELALMIDLLNRLTDRGYPISLELKKGLFDRLNQRLAHQNSFSTQDRYALIRLGSDAVNEEPPLKVMINGEQKILKSNQPIAADEIESFEALEPLFIQYMIEGEPKELTTATQFKMQYRNSLDAAEGRSYQVGEQIEVSIEITPEIDLPNALLTAMIPGGFNLVNPHLIAGIDAKAPGDFDGERSSYSIESENLSWEDQEQIHEEYRLDRYVASLPLRAGEKVIFRYLLEASVPGEYQMPTTIIEDMYLPDRRNVMTQPGRIIITP